MTWTLLAVLVAADDGEPLHPAGMLSRPGDAAGLQISFVGRATLNF